MGMANLWENLIRQILTQSVHCKVLYPSNQQCQGIGIYGQRSYLDLLDSKDIKGLLGSCMARGIVYVK